MRVFAISDLHLPGGEMKPMDVFGAHWEGHFQRICADWQARVGEDDLVLLPGDISWAMQLKAAQPDLEAIGRLPGRKVMLRGNHDYWWSSLTQVRAALPQGLYALQNDALRFGGVIVCGTRGWLCPGGGALSPEDEKIYAREQQRLSMSLQAAKRLAGEERVRLIAMLHFPPFSDRSMPSGFTGLLEEAGVADVFYGHLHAQALQNAFSGALRGVRYHQVSCDGLDFKLFQLDA